MLARIARGLGKAALWVLAGVGVLAVWAAGALAGWLKDWGGPLNEQARHDAVAVVSTSVADAGADKGACACAGGQWCQGPQGGIYCLTAEGKKRYKAR